MIHRTLLDSLLLWKKQAVRKPLLIDGARQTGKTYLLQELFGRTFANTLRIDFGTSSTSKLLPIHYLQIQC